MKFFYKKYIVGLRRKNKINYILVYLSDTNFPEFVSMIREKASDRENFYKMFSRSYNGHTVYSLDELVEAAEMIMNINGVILISDSYCFAGYPINDKIIVKDYGRINFKEPLGGLII